MAIRYVPLGPLHSGEGSRAVLALRVLGVEATPCALVWAPEQVIADPDRVERLRRDTYLAAELGHPHVLRVFGLVELDGGLARAVEYADGEPLRRVLELAKRLPPSFAARVVADAALGVEYAHLSRDEHGAPVVHGDLRPETLLVTYSGVTKVSGYGALSVAPRELNGRRVVGRRRHCAPEQILGGRYAATTQTDVYLLGVVLYEALTGHIPFQDEKDFEKAVVTQQPKLLDSSYVPDKLRPVLGKAMAKKSSLRFSGVQAFREAVEEAVGGLPDRSELAGFLAGVFSGEGGRASRQRQLEHALRELAAGKAPAPQAAPPSSAAPPAGRDAEPALTPVPGTSLVVPRAPEVDDPPPTAPQPDSELAAAPAPTAPQPESAPGAHAEVLAPAAASEPAAAPAPAADPAADEPRQPVFAPQPAAVAPAPQPDAPAQPPVAAAAPALAAAVAPPDPIPAQQPHAAPASPARAPTPEPPPCTEARSPAQQPAQEERAPAAEARSASGRGRRPRWPWRAGLPLAAAAAIAVTAFWMGRRVAPAPGGTPQPARQEAPAAGEPASRAQVEAARADRAAPGEAGRPERQEHPAPAPRAEKGTLEIVTHPPLGVSIDGKATGRTPLKLELATGSHRVALADPAQGIRVVRAVHVRPGANRLALKFGKGSLTVRAPPGCEVRIDGRLAGRTPLDGPVTVFEGAHRIQVSLGDARWQHPFSIRDGEQLSADVEFQRRGEP